MSTAAYDTTLEQPSEVHYCRPDRETILRLRREVLSTAQAGMPRAS